MFILRGCLRLNVFHFNSHWCSLLLSYLLLEISKRLLFNNIELSFPILRTASSATTRRHQPPLGLFTAVGARAIRHISLMILFIVWWPVFVLMLRVKIVVESLLFTVLNSYQMLLLPQPYLFYLWLNSTTLQVKVQFAFIDWFLRIAASSWLLMLLKLVIESLETIAGSFATDCTWGLWSL